MPKAKPIVLVTGASGYVGLAVVKAFLDSNNYAVRGTVRDPTNEAKVAPLKALPNQASLTLFKADLLDSAETWDAAVSDCAYVVHTASPFVLSPKDVQRDLLDPAIKGTEAVLSAIARNGKVEKTVVTSSIGAIMCDKWDVPEHGYVYSEKDWNTAASATYNPYIYSKVMAERRAWEIAKEANFDLCCINPGFVMGPPLSKTSSTSLTFMADLIQGKFSSGAVDDRQCMVDVRDVAKAHVLAIEKGVPGKRYLCAHGSRVGINYVQMGAHVEKAYPSLAKKLPHRNFGKPIMYLVGKLAAGISPYKIYMNFGLDFNYDVSLIEQDLGMEWTSLDDTFGEMAKKMEELGMCKLE
ncbi:hypothetical protein TrST_g2947 [Triparma strigata]|uniref:NAD-dependent epimerase/dehydratase domain-containing protein n=1 Tax=Triparma strigata TaxID=1606541 RepID=A0A9W7B3N4_9STRA|nr:hypothetical protein TrST_g2947 [Triparma strigata]